MVVGCDQQLESGDLHRDLYWQVTHTHTPIVPYSATDDRLQQNPVPSREILDRRQQHVVTCVHEES
ncbi:MAG TPA: hypothetical protein ENN68_00190 [Methanomicrobia archaeon]|nr:hypothetical protein [Methanomicrobia archaeon]